MTTPLRFGVLGCGSFARRRMLPALAGHTSLRLVAVASRDRERAAACAAGFGCAATDYHHLLRRADVDAVYLALPAALHAEWAEAALSAGKHVLVEKPATMAAADTERLLATAARRGLVLRENVLFPHHSQHPVARRLVEDGRLGRVRTVHAWFGIPLGHPGNVRYVPELGGGALSELGGYPIRLIVRLLGPGCAVTGAVLRTSTKLGIDMAGQVTLATPDGVLGFAEFGLDQCYDTRCVVSGDRARLELDRPFTPPPAYQPRLSLTEQDHREEFVLAADDQLANALAAFHHAVETGATAGTEHEEDSLHTARLVDTVRETAVRVPGPD